MRKHQSFIQKLAILMEKRSGWVLLSVAMVTGLLVLPMALMTPKETASDNPGGEVFELEKLIGSNLPPRVHAAWFVVEAKDGDILTQAPLLELYQNEIELRHADSAGNLNPPSQPRQPYLFSGFDVDRKQPVEGVFTLADIVQETLSHPPLNTDLESATDEQVKLALHIIFKNPKTESMKRFLSIKTATARKQTLGQEIDYWVSPAMTFAILADNEKFGGGSQKIGSTSDPITQRKEHFNRKAQAILRGEQSNIGLWGMAIDASLETEDEVGTAVPFIIATAIMVLVVMGISLKSIRVIPIAALGLAFMIIWLKGMSNLVGLNSSTTLDFIVPIAMISLGADFGIHAVSRYREERQLIPGKPRVAFRLGMSGVLTALVLAMATDSVAFLSNTSANIETVVGFGIGAGLSIFAAFIIMGIALPISLMRLDDWQVHRTHLSEDIMDMSSSIDTHADTRLWSLETLVVWLASRRHFVIPLVVAITTVSGYYALQLDASFDVEDFFRRDSDFVVGLDKNDEHVGDSAGESAIIYIQGDLENPKSLKALEKFLIQQKDNPYVAKTGAGDASLQARSVFTILEQVMRSEYALTQIELLSGEKISGSISLEKVDYLGDVYRRPGSKDHIEAIFDYVSVNGVPLNDNQKVYDALEVGETLFHDPAGIQEDATIIVLGIPGTRQQETVIKSREWFSHSIRELADVPSISIAGLTGSPYTRQASLDATTEGLQKSLVLAVAACMAITVLAMRSVRYGVVTIIPIVLVVIWLYAFMYVFNFGLNFVTATIGAVSLGVGIDFAIHMTQRYREELSKSAGSLEALTKGTRGTGVALVASAASSIVGFGIMAFAPMPMFASYGILTAVMIFMAAVASLLVLPSLLIMVTPSREPGAKHIDILSR